MKRAFLTDLGITDGEVIKKIIDFHQGVVQDLKDDLSTANNSLKTAQSDLKTANKTIESLKSDSANNDDEEKKWKSEYENLSKTISDKDGKTWKEKYESLNGEFDTYKQTVEAEKNIERKTSKLEQKLLNAGANAKYVKKIIKDFDINALEEDGDNFKDWDKHFEQVKPSWAEMFGTTTVEGVNPATPPPNNNITQDPFITGFDGK